MMGQGNRRAIASPEEISGQIGKMFFIRHVPGSIAREVDPGDFSSSGTLV